MKEKISIRKLAEQAMKEVLGTYNRDAAKASMRMADLIIETLRDRKDLHIPEIGKLVVKKYGPRQGYDPVREVVVTRRPSCAVRLVAYTAAKKHAEAKGV